MTPGQDQGAQPAVHEDLRPDAWLRNLLLAFFGAGMGLVFALNAPEPVDCQRDGETATFAEGCQP